MLSDIYFLLAELDVNETVDFDFAQTELMRNEFHSLGGKINFSTYFESEILHEFSGFFRKFLSFKKVNLDANLS